jgi:hypothetical protein
VATEQSAQLSDGLAAGGTMPVPVTADELAQMEARIKAELDRLVSEQVSTLAAREAVAPRHVSEADLQQVRSRLAEVEDTLRDQVRFASLMDSRVNRAFSRSQPAGRPMTTDVSFILPTGQ